MDSIIDIQNLSVSFATEQGRLRAVDQVSFGIKSGEILGLVGESGCGKSVTAMSLMRLLPQPSAVIEEGSIMFGGLDLARCSQQQLRKVRGNRIAMIFQEPMTALNPVYRIDRQLAESLKLHVPNLSPQGIHQRCLELMSDVGIPAPEQRLRDYPHQLSGGMRQRVMIAIALACEPDLLIADEPTTALDVTTQAQILKLIMDLNQKKKMAVMLITHDLGVIAETCNRVVVMYAGRVVEQAPTRTLFKAPRHPYTQGLLASMPSLATQPKTKLPTIEGMVPSLAAMPQGCRFANRCSQADDSCTKAAPPKVTLADDHWAFCRKIVGNTSR